MIKNIVLYPILLIIKIYQTVLSPILPSTCRYSPTCSEYTKQSLIKFGLIKGGMISIKRIIKCNPWGGNGYDPIP
ncbi:membrane protein insertion efficiency factor YidD [Flavobacteriaceae bacterium]|jgi:putative membrane protein insertion efficiency factor|nr:membrane protein insertion efficiency factor YidD [Flavobacteriaceae bacterium]MDB0069102.1 membrane protein insertion efficiency factor YidD [Flavobacteriaceae bacterium]MDB4093271.1 membrane protein insertion efficiency factor YidD [Flavobacteriaceae bacterium]MDB4164122.1 membrane protein insertion efficiency factor YidD [Flavobacteriaceae bacterium]MDB9793733.1 membrane protein insertion efficiency factor YidD [Flavobacteriaceae bacterium]|tara:strand:+ start:4368 stop:4592 length:225 start_codon:yes stop_codon:yes gene_type:complete